VKALTFLLVTVVLAKVRGFKLMIAYSLCFVAWLDRSRSIARSTALGMAFSFFGAFVIIYHELKNDFIGRLKLNFGSIDCEFGGLSPLASTSVEKCHNFF